MVQLSLNKCNVDKVLRARNAKGSERKRNYRVDNICAHKNGI